MTQKNIIHHIIPPSSGSAYQLSCVSIQKVQSMCTVSSISKSLIFMSCYLNHPYISAYAGQIDVILVSLNSSCYDATNHALCISIAQEPLEIQSCKEQHSIFQDPYLLLSSRLLISLLVLVTCFYNKRV